jgi:hypothetical protein
MRNDRGFLPPLTRRPAASFALKVHKNTLRKFECSQHVFMDIVHTYGVNYS